MIGSLRREGLLVGGDWEPPMGFTGCISGTVMGVLQLGASDGRCSWLWVTGASDRIQWDS